MKLFKTSKGIILQNKNRNYFLKGDWDEIINRNNLFEFLSQQINDEPYFDESEFTMMMENFIQSPMGPPGSMGSRRHVFKKPRCTNR